MPLYSKETNSQTATKAPRCGHDLATPFCYTAVEIKLG